MDVAQQLTTTLRLISENGQSLSVSRRAASYNLVTDASNGAAATTGTWVAYDAPLTEQTIRTYDLTWRANSDTAQARLLLVAASGITLTPALYDKVTLNDATWNVFGVTEIALQGTAILYLVGVQRE